MEYQLRTLIFLFLALSFGEVCWSNQPGHHIWLIGGGNQLSRSQGQIELNVLWAKSVLEAKVEPASLSVFYSDGDDKRPDVVLYDDRAEESGEFYALAQVFGQSWNEQLKYKNHRIKDVVASTQKSSLKPKLTEGLLRLNEQDQALLVYNGHGSLNAKDITDNALLLWNNSRMSVRDLDEILNLLPKRMPVRLVFTQCFSGAFANVMYRELLPESRKSKYNRCGFFAESAYREAEGCSAAIRTGDYRDYSTYFFAALGGSTRQGKKIDTLVDRNGDGQVSLREAHFYTLQEAFSKDLSRSTSEVFLEDWQKWYMKWHTTSEVPDNEYGRLALALQKKYDIDSAKVLYKKRTELQLRYDEQRSQMKLKNEQVGRLQKAIRRQILQRWPELAHPYTSNFMVTLNKEKSKIRQFIYSNSDFEQLRVQIQSMMDFQAVLLDSERLLTQLDKIKRMRKLARILYQFELLARDSRRNEFKQLIECEEAIFSN